MATGAVGFQPNGTAAGTVFSDTNGDGIQQGTEPNMAGVTVTAVDSLGVTHMVTTDSHGVFNFVHLASGAVTVTVSTPAGTSVTTANAALSTTIDALGATLESVGFQPTGGVSGSVFSDTTGNGSLDGREPILSGVAVT